MANGTPQAIRTRRDVWKLAPWDPILIWYAKAIAEMQTRPIADPTSWRYQAAIHDYLRKDDPNANPKDVLPTDQKRFWKQCQHGSWFFLPWHRMYLGYFEAIVRDAIAKLGGPADDWALPYWNYSDTSNPKALHLPPAFYAPKLPDGSSNALLVTQRNTGLNSGGSLPAFPPSTDPADDVDIQCLKDAIFTGAAQGAHPGFGGPTTKFHHNGGVTGDLERVPHGSVHDAVGGDTGWMSAFDTAGLDPIFWLHHSNIDRLWAVWVRRDSGFVNPTDKAWLTAPFEFHDATGAVATLTPSLVLDSTTSPFAYQYEDISDPFKTPPKPVAEEKMLTMSTDATPEMVGATDHAVSLPGGPATVHMALNEPAGPARLARAAGAPPRKVFLNIENITAKGRARSYAVYLNVASPENPHEDKSLLAGILPMFGVPEASDPDAEHGGSGLTYSLDVTNLVEQLQARGKWDPSNLQVTFAPRSQTAVNAEIQVGRVSLYYQ